MDPNSINQGALANKNIRQDISIAKSQGSQDSLDIPPKRRKDGIRPNLSQPAYNSSQVKTARMMSIIINLSHIRLNLLNLEVFLSLPVQRLLHTHIIIVCVFISLYMSIIVKTVKTVKTLLVFATTYGRLNFVLSWG